MRALYLIPLLIAPTAISRATEPYQAPVLQWFTALGGSGISTATAVATDGQGNLYITGNTTSLDLPTVAAVQSHPGGSPLVRLDPVSAAAQKIYFQGATAIGTVVRIAADPRNPMSIYAASSGGVFYSQDGANTWSNLAPLPGGVVVNGVIVDPTNGTPLYVSAAPGGAFKSTDRGATWAAINQGVPPAYGGRLGIYQIWVDPKSPAVLFASIPNGLLRSADAGASWTQVLGQVFGLAFDPFTAGKIYACTPQAVVESADDGRSWTALSVFSTGGNPIANLVPDPLHQGTLYGAGTGGLFVSTDSGVSWTEKVNGNLGSFTALAIDPSTNVVYAGGWPNGVLASNNGFATSTLLAPQISQVSEIAVAGAKIYILSAPTTNVFVAKLDANGNFVHTTYFGGSGNDTAAALAVGADGSVYVTGATNSTDFPITSATFMGGGKASYLFKLKPDGSLAWSTFFADANTTVRALAVDADGDAYLTGSSEGGLPTTAGVYQPSFQAAPFSCGAGGFFCVPKPVPTAAFLTKFNATGSGLVFSTYVANDAHNQVITNASAIALAPDGSIDLAGPANYLYAFQPTSSAIFAMNGEGSGLLADNFQPGITINALAVDRSSNVYVTGLGSAPTTSGAFQTSLLFPAAELVWNAAVDQPAFVTEFDSGLSHILNGTLLSGESGELGASIAIDSAGHVITAGNTGSRNFPARAPFQGNFGVQGNLGTGSGYLAGLDPALSQLLFSTFIGNGPFQLTGAIPDNNGNILLAGSTPSTVYANKIALRPAPSVRLDSVVNAASRIAGALSPGETVSALGAGIGEQAQLIINGEPAMVLARSATSVTAVVPADIPATGAITVKITSGGTDSNSMFMPAALASPGIYSVNGSGVGQAYILNSDGTVNSSSNPAVPGSPVTILATGVGAIHYVGPYAVTDLPVSIYVDGFYADGIAAFTRQVPGIAGPVYEISVYVPNPALMASQNPNLAGFVFPPQAPLTMVVGDVSQSNPDFSTLVSQSGIAISLKQ